MSRLALALLFLFSYSSCTDQGCIEADDFGEYEQQILNIPANAQSNSCDYNSSDSVNTYSNAGSGVKQCLIAGQKDIYDENNVHYISQTGCLDIKKAACSPDPNNPTKCNAPANITNICTSQCQQECLSGNNTASGNVSSPATEPSWTSTSAKVSGQNTGVTITPGAEIQIRAIGNVNLGGEVGLPPLKVDSSYYYLQSSRYDNSLEFFNDVKSGKSNILRFSGQWSDFTDHTVKNDGTIITNNTATIGSGSGTDLTSAYNGARRLAAYVITAPNGYDFDATKATEQDGSINVPLNADPALWKCTYSGTGGPTDAVCASDSYKINGYKNYPNVIDDQAFALYSISSAGQSPNLGMSGGIIRWSNDGLTSFLASYPSSDPDDPFNGITCNPNCSGGTMPGADKGGIISLNPEGITNASNYAVRVSFKNLSNNTSCNAVTISITGQIVKNADGTTTSGTINNPVLNNPGGAIATNGNIVVSNTSWSVDQVILEPNDKMTISPISSNYSTSPVVNCGQVMAYRFNKLQDIKILKSGYLSFSMLSAAGAAGSCNLNLRIVNPGGSRNSFATTNGNADFYEEDYPRIISVTPNSWTADRNKLFLRKGQILRLNPESWNGIWIPSPGLTRKCGIGMAMQIMERPALLCRGATTESVDNPSCKKTVDSTGNPTGCMAYAQECYVSGGPSYCPSASCQTITAYPSSCTQPGLITSTTCASCRTKMDHNADPDLNKPLVPLTMAQCYDLENYYGRVSNIPLGILASDFVASTAAKGAAKLSIFSGSYGNFESFADSGDVETSGANINYHIFQTTQPLVYGKNGRLKFMILDGSDFNPSTVLSPFHPVEGQESYTATSGSNSGNYKIYLAGKQEFTNGEMLEAILCKESSDTSLDCSNTTPPTGDNLLPDQPLVVQIDPATIGSVNIGYKSFFKFDDAGSILRIENSNAVGPIPVNAAGSNFYEHNWQYLSDADLKLLSKTDADARAAKIAKLRLTFKIHDTDVPDCLMSNPTITSAPPSNADGIKTTNKYYVTDGSCQKYDSSNNCISTSIASENDNEFCTANSTPGPYNGTTTATNSNCQKQFICANPYSNNTGSYQVIVKVKNVTNGGSNISDIVNSVITPVMETIDGPAPNCKIDDPNPTASHTIADFNGFKNSDGNCGTLPPGQAERIYRLIIDSGKYKAILNICLVMMLTFYGVGYLMGISEFSQSELIARTVKISIIYLFVSPGGWEWFQSLFVQFFKEGTNYIAFLMASAFDSTPELQQAIASHSYYDKSILFSSVDKVFGLFFSGAVQKKISALLFTGIFGWAYLYIIYMSFMLYVYSVATAILLYLTAQVFISILFVLAPIFFLFLLFGQTKEMFDKWLSQLIGFSLQQVFLLTTLAFFNMMMYEVIKLSLGYRICWDDVWVINIITRIKLLSFWTIASMPPTLALQSGSGDVSAISGIPSIFSILFIWVVASLMEKFVTFMTDLAADLGGGLKASELGAGVKDSMQKLQKTFADHGGKGIEFAIHKPFQKIDRALFDSGKEASQARRQRRELNQKESTQRSALAKAGDKEVKDYKRKNADSLSTKTKAEQRAELAKVRDNAMIAQGKKLGLDEDASRKLMNDKGLKFEGTNVFGAAYQASKQALTKGGSLTSSMTEKKVDTTFSRKDIDKSMKNLDKKGREKLLEGVTKGRIGVGTTAKEEWNKMSGKRKLAAVLSLGTTEALGRGGKAAYSAAKGGVSSLKESDEAAEQLVREGAISKMMAGTGWARNDAEKKKISDRVKENQAKKALDTSQNTQGAAAFAALQSQIAEELEEGKGGEFTRDKDSLAAKVLGKEKGVISAAFVPFFKESKNRKAKDKLLAAGLGDKVEDEYLAGLRVEEGAAEKELRDSKDIYTKALDTIDDLENNDEIPQMKDWQDQLKKATDPNDIKKLQRQISELSKEPEYIKKSEALDKAYHNVNEYKKTGEVAGAKLRNIRQAIQDYKPEVKGSAEEKDEAIHDDEDFKMTVNPLGAAAGKVLEDEDDDKDVKMMPINPLLGDKDDDDDEDEK